MAIIPKDLQRFKIDGGQISPQYVALTPAIETIASQLLDCFRYAPGTLYGDLCDSLEDLCVASPRHRLLRGMIHVLESRLVFDGSLKIDPEKLRESLFMRAGKMGSEVFLDPECRKEILQATASECGISAHDIERGLYADLKDERKIVDFNGTDERGLVGEYNLSMAKSLLMYAREFVFTIVLDGSRERIRRLFQRLRFFNLLFETERITENAFQFRVDGPCAVIEQPQKYSLSLASFFPTLFEFSSWHATASVDIDGKSYQWQISPGDFEMDVPECPERLPELSRQLSDRILESLPQCGLSLDCPLVDIGGQCVWIPDFSLHPSTFPCDIHVVIVEKFRTPSFSRRIGAMRAGFAADMSGAFWIFILHESANFDESVFDRSNIRIIKFKKTPKSQDVIRCIQYFATQCRS